MSEENENETPLSADGEPLELDVPESSGVPDEEVVPACESQAARIVELEGELAQMRDQTLRALAEAENLRKRAERQLEDAHRYAVTGFARDILSIGDNLERALESIPDDRRGEHELLQTLLEGVIAVQNDFLSALAAHKIERLDPSGEPFDPNLHEAMYEIEDTDTPAGTIAQVLEPGYVLHGRTLRAAKVGITKGGPKEVQPPAVDAPTEESSAEGDSADPATREGQAAYETQTEPKTASGGNLDQEL